MRVMVAADDDEKILNKIINYYSFKMRSPNEWYKDPLLQAMAILFMLPDHIRDELSLKPIKLDPLGKQYEYGPEGWERLVKDFTSGEIPIGVISREVASRLATVFRWFRDFWS